MNNLEARQTTRAYGGMAHEIAEAAWAKPLPTARHATEDLGTPSAVSGPVRIWIEGHGERIEVPLALGAEVVIGTGAAVGVQLADPSVSAQHCRVAHVGGFIEVTDLGATNGVRVGGVRVARAALPVGGVCAIGRTTLRVMPKTAATAERGAPLAGLVGRALPMCVLASAVRRIAPMKLPALLRGESGTGKDLVARAIHDESPRAASPFVVLNAAAISPQLAESELFGHKRGAFTGAVRDRRGAFREADGGTLFLDEIGAVPMDLQAKLLRAVEEGAVRPVGTESAAAVDVRLVVATCEPLEKMVAERRFRQDLYERLAVCVISVPPLRDRLDDVPLLAKHLIKAAELGRASITEDAMAVLRAHHWPGNVRELRNVIVQAAVLADGTIDAEHVAAVLADRVPRGKQLPAVDALRIFEEADRNVSRAARHAGVPRSTMKDLLRRAGVPPWPMRREG